MVEMELEEGEACSYRDDDDYESSVDPDLGLSYIDEKLQDVLGHFQKDFEGGVSAENLGAKFGGYGSFLPSYLRSPSGNSRSPSKVQQDNAQKPSKTFQLEDGHLNSVASYPDSQRGRHLTACSNAMSMPSSKDVIKKEGSAPSICTEEFVSRYESANLLNDKMMNLQLKVGSDNVSTQKRAAIYSGLGLDVSPSSSLEENHSGNEGILHGYQNARFESPTSILQIMTSFPVPGDLLLSPLPDNLLRLTKTEDVQEDHKCVIVSGLEVHPSNFRKDMGKVSRRMKVRSQQRNVLSIVAESDKRKGSRNSNAVSESGLDPACEEMVSGQLPVLFNVDSPLDDMTRTSSEAFCKSREGNGSIMRANGFENVMEQETLSHRIIHDDSGTENPEAYPTRKFLDYKEDSASDCLFQINNQYRGPEKYGIKASSHKEGKEKSKASRGQVKLDTDVLEGSLHGLSSNNRSMKNTWEAESNSETEFGELKAGRSSQNRDRYKDIFGDVEHEEDQHGMVMQGSGTIKTSVSVRDSKLRERLDGKIIGELSATEAHLDAAPEVVPGSEMSMLGAVFADGCPSSEEDNWVYCDKCQKRSLVPPGTNPQNLPDKLRCCMLDYLPTGTNKWGFSQEKTTNAVRAMCQATAPDAQTHVKQNPGLLDIVASSPHYDDIDIPSLQILPVEVNNKCLAEVSDMVKKNMKVSAKSGNLNYVKHASLEREDDIQQLGKSSHGTAREATKEKVPKDSSEGGDVSNSKFRRTDRDHSKSSKKVRNMSIDSIDDGGISDHDVLIMKTCKNSNSTVLSDSHKENRKCHTESPLRVPIYDSAGKSDFMVDHPSGKPPASMNKESGEVGAPGGAEYVSKRRKTKEVQNGPTSLTSLPSERHYHEENGVLVQENECKANAGLVSSKGKNSTANIQNRKVHGECGQMKNLQQNYDLASTGVASMKRELGLTQPPVPATSSSSKASSCLKSKASFHDMRDSPIESVSSSPTRSLRPDNLTLAKQTISEKHDFDDAADIPAGGSYSSGVVIGRGDESTSERKDKTCAVAPNGSLESSILGPDRNNFSGNSDKAKVSPSTDISNGLSLRNDEDSLGHGNQYPTRSLDSDKCSGEERENEKNCKDSSLNIKEPEKLYSSRSKDKNRKSLTEGMESSKLSNAVKDMQDFGTDVRTNQENTSIRGEAVQQKQLRKEDSVGEPCWNNKRKCQSNPGDTRCSEDATSKPNCDDSESRKKISSRKANQPEIASEEKALALHDVSTSQKQMPKDSSKPVPRSQSTNGVENLPASLSSNGDTLEMARKTKKADHQDRNQHTSSRHFTSNGHRVRDMNAPSPVRRDSASHAAVNALKEAKDLKHLADRLKNGGSSSESIGLYFQAALKFLHGASLLEPSNSESSKRGDMVQAVQIYGSTAKLCEFCAHEYEKSKDMASAALAYKCMEVAYLKVVYSSHNNAGKDRQLLLKAIAPANMEKVGQSKDTSSPQVAGSQTIAATERPNFVRLLNFAQNVSSAMDASRKSRIAFAAANASSTDPKFKEVISSIKSALDYNFQDVEGLLRLVRLATESISRLSSAASEYNRGKLSNCLPYRGDKWEKLSESYNVLVWTALVSFSEAQHMVLLPFGASKGV